MGDAEYPQSVTVIVEAKGNGEQYNFNNVATNATFISFNVLASGTATDPLNSSKVIIDIYAEETPSKQAQMSGNDTIHPHIITCEKAYYKDGITFDISNILKQHTNDGDVTEYNISAYYMKDGQMHPIATLPHNYCANGYSVNQSNYYISPYYTDCYFAQHVTRGTDKGYYNRTNLYYIDGEDITMSFLCYNLNEKTITVKYLDSAEKEIKTETMKFTPTKTLYHWSFKPTTEAYYVDVVTPEQGTVRYTNIRPQKYGNVNEYQVLQWYNEYGGISFAPLTFDRTEERTSEVTTYKRQMFDIYEKNVKELNKIYDREMEYEVTLKTHYMHKDGIYLFYSLLHSYNCWTYINNIKYSVIINDVQIEETATNDIYQVTVKYQYSLTDTFM